MGPVVAHADQGWPPHWYERQNLETPERIESRRFWSRAGGAGGEQPHALVALEATDAERQRPVHDGSGGGVGVAGHRSVTIDAPWARGGRERGCWQSKGIGWG